MTNIYVSPLASPSLECLSPAELTNEEDEQEVPNRDENQNDVFKGVTKTCERMRGHAFETPSGTITTLRLSTGNEDATSPKRSPVYCFHSFTYGSGTGLHDGEKTPAELNGNDTWEQESFDADSPNVWCTRTVVDPDESGSPTILHDWNLRTEEECLLNGSSKETSQTEPSEAFQSEVYVKLQSPETAVTSVAKEVTTENAPVLLSAQEVENSGEGSSEKNGDKPLVMRLSPEGAESSVVNAQISDRGNTASYLVVPTKRAISDGHRRELAGSPSGVIDVKNYWMSGEIVEEREVVDGDRVPLICPEKFHMRYTTEVGLEEVEEGTPVTCFPCWKCVVL